MLSDSSCKPQTRDDSIYAWYRQKGGQRRGAWELLFNRCGVSVWQDEDFWERTVVLNLKVLDPTDLYTHGGQNARLCFNPLLKRKWDDQLFLTSHFP